VGGCAAAVRGEGLPPSLFAHRLELARGGDVPTGGGIVDSTPGISTELLLEWQGDAPKKDDDFPFLG
jgi:hypothetical protein